MGVSLDRGTAPELIDKLVLLFMSEFRLPLITKTIAMIINNTANINPVAKPIFAGPVAGSDL